MLSSQDPTHLAALREFLAAEWPVDAHRGDYEAELAAAETINTEASEKFAEARLIEEETLRKLRLASSRNYVIADFVEFLKELHVAKALRAEASDCARRRVEKLQQILASEEAALGRAEDFIALTAVAKNNRKPEHSRLATESIVPFILRVKRLLNRLVGVWGRPAAPSLRTRLAACTVPTETTRPERVGEYFVYARNFENSGLAFCRVPRTQALWTRPEEEERLFELQALGRLVGEEVSDLHAVKLNAELLGVVCAGASEACTLALRRLDKEHWSIVENVRQFEFLDDRGVQGEFRLLVTRQDPESRRADRVQVLEVAGIEELKVESLGEVESLNTENDQETVDVVKSKSGGFVYVNVTKARKQVKAVAFRPDSAEILRNHAVRDLRCEGDSEIFLENFHEDKFLVFKCSGAKFAVELDSAVIFESNTFKVKDVDVFKNTAVLYGHNSQAESEIYVLKLDGENCEILRVPNAQFALGKVSPGLNSEFETRYVSFEFQSPISPRISLQLDLATNRVAVAHVTELAREKKFRTEAERVFVSENSVPLTIFRNSDFSPHNRPCLLINYGVYGEVLEPQFTPQFELLLSQGWSLAFAHIRGGGDCGEAWHVTKANKAKSVDDLLACVAFLRDERRHTVFAQATSAGAAVLAAAVNRNPADFHGVVMRMPFVDVLGAMSRTNSQSPDFQTALSNLELAEWGSVDEHREFLAAFSGVQNVRGGPDDRKYPDFFITAALDDARVDFDAVNQYVKKLEQAGTRVVLNQVTGGHFGRLDADSQLDIEAAELEFLLLGNRQ